MRVNTGMTAWEDGSMSLTLRSITFFHSAKKKNLWNRPKQVYYSFNQTVIL